LAYSFHLLFYELSKIDLSWTRTENLLTSVYTVSLTYSWNGKP